MKNHLSIPQILGAAALGLVLLSVSAPAALAQTPTPTPGGDCCNAHDGPSCDNQACSQCVCDIDPASCLGIWDDQSVLFAKNDCNDVCQCFPPGGDCCTTGPDRGPMCDDLTCQACVCGIDAECCNFKWDATCVSEASEECAGSCTCAPLPTETPAPTPTPGGDCCQEHTGASCDDQACRTCVCDLDGPCCSDVWDQTCADEASVECALACDMCASGGDCCAVHDDVGCNDATCKDCVCGIDTGCCTDTWDQQCVDESNVECAASCTCEVAGGCCVEHPDTVGCDDRACQNCVCAVDESCCAEGWDATCADESANECAARCSECAVEDCCAERTDPGCPSRTACEDCVCAFDDPCCTTVWDGQCGDEAANECAAECGCAVPACAGDCDGDGEVSVANLIVAVNIALGNAPIADCTAVNTTVDDQVSVAELIQAVNSALNGCPQV